MLVQATRDTQGIHQFVAEHFCLKVLRIVWLTSFPRIEAKAAKFLEDLNASLMSILCVGPYGSNQYWKPPMDARARVSEFGIANESSQEDRRGNEHVPDL